jgi:hypothetical protein
MTKPHSKTMPTPLLIDQLAIVTGGLLAWEASPAMSSVPTGFGAWERSLKAKNLL